MLEEIMPHNTYMAMEGTLTDIITTQRGGLLSIGFIAALFFSTNGINAMIDAFNATSHSFDTQKGFLFRDALWMQ